MENGELKMDNEENHQFKKTDFGFNSEEWKEYELGDLFDFLKGKKLPKSVIFDDAPYKCLHYGELFTHYLEKITEIKSRTYQNKSESVLSKSNDVLMPTSDVTPNGLAKASCINQDGVILGGDVLIIRAKERKKVNGVFLSYLIRLNKEEVMKRISGTTVYHLYGSDLKTFPVKLPNFDEQQAIAAALSDVDGLIDSLEKLIAKKRDMKTATMQQLLTGKKRLPDFDASKSYKQTGIGILPEDWDLALLGEIFEITSSKRVFQNEWQKSGVPFYRARELAVLGEKGEVDNDLFIDHDLYEKHKRNYGVPQIDDVLVTGVGTLGKVYVVPDESLFYFKDGNIIWFKVRGRLNSYFLKQLYYTPLIEHQISESSAGSTVGTYTITGAKKTLIPVPKLEEQKAIAGVLSDMDYEINSLEQRLKKARSLKTGMMQELLTGKTRLIQPAMQAKVSKIKHNKYFEDAVIIAVLADRFGSEEFPLHRFRYTKFSYLLRRRIQQNTEQYLKKVAGPYNPQTRYGGAETISINKKYVNVKNKGFIAGNDIDEAKKYFDKWFEIKSLDWLERFRFTTNERLELWTTVDMAMQDLRKQNRKVTVSQIKNVIQSNKEWNKKLSKELFSDANIQKAIDKSLDLFGH